MRIAVQALYRYPVKGLSPERLEGALLTADAYFPGDRLYAVENGPAGFDPKEPRHQPKIKFLMLMRDEKLAALQSTYDDATTTLVVTDKAGNTVCADLSTRDGRQALEAFIRRTVPEALRGPPGLLEAPAGFRFTDSRSGFVSLINPETVKEISEHLGRAIDPLRFRGNIHLSGLPPWEEFSWIDRIVTLGPVRLNVTKRIQRCAAINVEPGTGVRNLDIPNTLRSVYGHVDCGVYARIVTGGLLREDDPVTPEQGTLSLE